MECIMCRRKIHNIDEDCIVLFYKPKNQWKISKLTKPQHLCNFCSEGLGINLNYIPNISDTTT